MKKIGFLIGSLSGAGAEKTILTIASGLAEKGHEVHLFVLKNRADYDVPQNVVTHFTEQYADQPRKALKKISQQLGPLDLFVSSRAEFYRCVESVINYCSVHITPTEWLQKRRGLFAIKTFFQKLKLKKKFANKNLIALSQGIKEDLVGNLEVEEKRVVVISNPFDIDLIQNKANETTEGLHLPDSYIIYVAALIRRKRHEDLIHAFSRIENKQVKLLLVGKGKEEARLKKLVSDLGLSNRVVFKNWDPNPYRLIKNAEISILASEAEGMPRVLIESIIIGTPVISSDCRSGPNEVLVGENKDFLYPVGNIEALSHCIDKVLLNKPRQDIDVRRFDKKTVIKMYEDIVN